MAETFYTLLTKAGQGELANATTFGTKVNFTKFKVGDGNGAYYEPTETQTDLVNVVWTGNVQSVSVDANNSNWIVIEAIIPTSDGGFTIREMGLFDDKNNLLAISKCAETYKPVITDGSTKELWMKMVLVVTNTSVVNLKIDPSIIFATKQDLKNLETKIESELDDFNFQTAGGTATTITLKMNQFLENGLPLNFVASYDNNGQTTTVNGKRLYKPNTTISPKLKTGKGYTIWYNSSKDCFFIKASAEGTATKECVLAGYTFSSDDEIDAEGIIVNNGALGDNNFPINGTYTIPAGITSGGIITQNISIKNAQTYMPTTIDQMIPLGQYLKGNQILKGDSNLISDKIISPFSIFGVQGSATIQNLGGYKFVTGICTSLYNNVYEWYNVYGGSIFGDSEGKYGFSGSVDITGFDFTPRFGIIKQTNKNGSDGLVAVTFLDGMVLIPSNMYRMFSKNENSNIIASYGRLRIPVGGLNIGSIPNSEWELTYYIFG